MKHSAETTKFWHDQALGNLELLRATYVTHTFAPHVHEGYAIGVIEGGAETFTYRGATHVAGAGSLVVIQPGEVHTGQAVTAAGWRYRMLYPDAAHLQQAASQLAGAPRDFPFFAAAVIADPPLAQQFVRLHTQLEAGVSVLQRESYWLAFLTQLIARHADDQRAFATIQPKADRVLLQQVVDYLAANSAASITLPALAAQVHLSPYHLLRLFKATFGLPPHAYLTQLRVQQAKRLLLTGLPIADVALQVGFVDQSHLTRHFKRIVGVPPGQFMPKDNNECIPTRP
ncbi:MAG: AraC family transcriptional regulator [Caldilineaceae bacterium]